MSTRGPTKCSRTKCLRTKCPGQNVPGQNVCGQNVPDKMSWTRSSQTQTLDWTLTKIDENDDPLNGRCTHTEPL